MLTELGRQHLLLDTKTIIATKMVVHFSNSDPWGAQPERNGSSIKEHIQTLCIKQWSRNSMEMWLLLGAGEENTVYLVLWRKNKMMPTQRNNTKMFTINLSYNVLIRVHAIHALLTIFLNMNHFIYHYKKYSSVDN